MKEIPNTNGLYFATEDGRIYSSISNKYLKPDLSGNAGYARVGLSGKRFLVHRLIALVYIGESKLNVNHKDGNKLNNHVSNLEYLSQKDNIKHAFENGLVTRAVICDRKKAIDLYMTGLTHQEIADELKCSRNQISCLLRKHFSKTYMKARGSLARSKSQEKSI